MLANKNFQTKFLISWQGNHYPITGHARKSLPTNTNLNKEDTNPQRSLGLRETCIMKF